jgi:hypothetical protein
MHRLLMPSKAQWTRQMTEKESNARHQEYCVQNETRPNQWIHQSKGSRMRPKSGSCRHAKVQAIRSWDRILGNLTFNLSHLTFADERLSTHHCQQRGALTIQRAILQPLSAATAMSCTLPGRLLEHRGANGDTTRTWQGLRARIVESDGLCSCCHYWDSLQEMLPTEGSSGALEEDLVTWWGSARKANVILKWAIIPVISKLWRAIVLLPCRRETLCPSLSTAVLP